MLSFGRIVTDALWAIAQSCARTSALRAQREADAAVAADLNDRAVWLFLLLWRPYAESPSMLGSLVGPLNFENSHIMLRDSVLCRRDWALGFGKNGLKQGRGAGK